MPKITPSLIKQVTKVCRVDPSTCRAALEAHDGDVDKAIRALISTGVVTGDSLNTKTADPRYVHLLYSKGMAERWKKATAKEKKQLGSFLCHKMEAAERVFHELTEDLYPIADRPPASPLEEAAAQLHKLCSRPIDRCKAVLKTLKNDVEAALRVMIRTGEVTIINLNNEVASDVHYALANMRETIEKNEKMHPEGRKIFGLKPDALKHLKKQLAGRIPVDPELIQKAAGSRNFLKMFSGPGILGGLLSGVGMSPAIAAREKALKKAKAAPRPKAKTLRMPPFPPLTLKFGWEGLDTLASWKGFQSRGGPYTSKDRSKPSTGKVRIEISLLPGDPTPPPAPEQIAAYKFLKRNHTAVTRAIVAAVFKTYQKPLKKDGVTPETLRDYIGLGQLHVLSIAKDGHAYIGFECGCDWDDEHGLGVMTHKDRIVKVGQADASFLDWVATKDGGKPISAEK